MSYQPTPWSSGDVITSRKLNKIEQGVAEVEQSLQRAKAGVNDLAGAIKSLEALRLEIAGWGQELDGKANAADLAVVAALAGSLKDRVAAKAEASGLAALAAEAETIRRDLDRLAGTIGDKAGKNDVGAVAALADRAAVQADRVADIVEQKADADAFAEVAALAWKLRDSVAMKADAADLADLALWADELRMELAALKAKVRQKADAEALGDVAVYAESITGRYDELEIRLQRKADSDELMSVAAEAEERERAVRNDMKPFVTKTEAGAVAAETENLRADMTQALSRKAERNELAAMQMEADRLRITQEAHDASILSLMSADASLLEGIGTKVPKPTGQTEGTSGQLLSTNGDGTTKWVDPFTPSGEQIGDAVAGWLEEHPEATTTVEDGSITREKLSDDVRDALDEAASGGDTETLAAALTIEEQREARTDSRELDAARLTAQYRDALDAYASFFQDDGLGFVFFTDPHSIGSRVYGTQEDMLRKQLRDIRTVFENTPARYVFCGGDWLNMYHTSREAAGLVGRVPNLLRGEIGERCYTVCGNHDTSTERPATQGDYLSQRYLARMWFDSDVGYYTVEGEDYTVFMFDSGPTELYSSYQQQNDYDLAQGAWLAEKLLSNTKPHLMGVIHVLARDNENGWFATVATMMLDAFNRRASYTLDGHTYDFSGAAGTFHFMMAGHFHNDGTYTRNNIPVIYTTHCVNRLLVDCCYADFDHAYLRTVRIGNDGVSRIIPIIPTGGSTAGAS